MVDKKNRKFWFFKRDLKKIEGLPAEENPLKMTLSGLSFILTGFTSAGRPSTPLKSRLKNLSKIESSYFEWSTTKCSYFFHPPLNVPIFSHPPLKYPILGLCLQFCDFQLTKNFFFVLGCGFPFFKEIWKLYFIADS